jgi:hypothetical protein
MIPTHPGVGIGIGIDPSFLTPASRLFRGPGFNHFDTDSDTDAESRSYFVKT